jgi:hypothetical protein
MNLKTSLSLGGALLALAAGSAQALTVASFTDFAGPVAQDGTFNAGDPINTFGVWGLDVATKASGGNPGSYLGLEGWNAFAWVAVAGNATADTYTFSFDYKLGPSWSANLRYYEVFGVSAGGSLTTLGNSSEGTVVLTNAVKLGGAQLALTTEWTSVVASIEIAVPYEAIVFKIGRDGSNGASVGNGLDNLIITNTASEIPEPSSFAAFAGMAGLAMAGLRRRRRA